MIFSRKLAVYMISNDIHYKIKSKTTKRSYLFTLIQVRISKITIKSTQKKKKVHLKFLRMFILIISLINLCNRLTDDTFTVFF